MEKRASDVHDLFIHSYPSPAEGHGLELEGSSHRSERIDISMEQQGGQAELPTPSQEGQVSVSAEELQLAAQLSQGLAGVVQESAQNANSIQDGNMSLERNEDNVLHAATPPSHDQAHLANGQSVEGQSHILDALEDAHHGLPSMEPSLQTEHHDVHMHDADLQALLPHATEVSAQQYAEAAAHAAQHMPHVQMAQMGQGVYSGVDAIPPRKRSKVSRACDECRRKKIKCDAVSETGDQACSNCRRSSADCRFSRVPQKRGPSKGYIKELADRINSIEGKLGGQVSAEAQDILGALRRETSEGTSSPAQLNDNHKRPFSSMSTDHYNTPPRPVNWGSASEPRTILPQPSAYTPALLAPRPSAPAEAELLLAPRPAAEPGPTETPMEHLVGIDDRVFDRYARM